MFSVEDLCPVSSFLGETKNFANALAFWLKGCNQMFSGSIIVNFELVASDDVTAAQLNEAYQDLVSMP